MQSANDPRTETHRAAGVLLHPTSLPGGYGIGELGREATLFLDWAASAGLGVWQVLPLNPTGFGGSPYGCLSAFAGNPLIISIERLIDCGLLDSADGTAIPRSSADRVDHVNFDDVVKAKLSILQTSWQRFLAGGSAELHAAFAAFVDADDQRDWLDDYALFMALRDRFGGAPWWEWGEPLVRRQPDAMRRTRSNEASAIAFWQYVQFLFFRQWQDVRDVAHARGIRIMGDLPIYVAGDSADVWAHRELFQLDERGFPTVVAGVPPDYFSKTGQRWGNPIYRWDVMRARGFRWWIARIRANLRLADLVRLDHFRGFAEYWEIPADEPTAVHGRWVPGPGTALFEAIRASLGDLPLVAEDLGFITDDVHLLRRSLGLPGMKILQFGFGEDDSPHLPHHYEPRTVVYTGTHDNDTARGWFEHASHDERTRALTYLGSDTNAATFSWDLIRAAYASIAEIAIIPAQDILSLDSEARMNTPGEENHNWAWRLTPGALTNEHAHALRRLAEITGRA
jgi:4-alpha-glucanotransferase